MALTIRLCFHNASWPPIHTLRNRLADWWNYVIVYMMYMYYCDSFLSACSYCNAIANSQVNHNLWGDVKVFLRLSHSGATRWPCSLNLKQHRAWLREKPQQPVLDVHFSHWLVVITFMDSTGASKHRLQKESCGQLKHCDPTICAWG